MCLNGLKGKMWKRDKSLESKKGQQNIMMNEKFVKNIAIKEEFVSVMIAQIHPKVLMTYPCSILVKGTIAR